jgi:uncharacterized membrane protein
MEEQTLKRIDYPNNAVGVDVNSYSEKDGFSFKYTLKNGEMAAINWIQVYRENVLVAEIKESICSLYY